MVTMFRLRSLAVSLLVGLLLGGCAHSPAADFPTSTPILSWNVPTLNAPVGADQPAATAPAEIAPTPEPAGYYIQPGVPQALADTLAPALNEAGLIAQESPEGAILRVVLDPAPGVALAGTRVYAVVAPFPTVPDGLNWSAFLAYWQTGSSEGLPDFGAPPQLVLTQDVADLLTLRYGPPSDALPLQIAYPYNLVEHAWGIRPAISVVPFDELTPRWKVLALDGLSVLDEGLNLATYPLVARIGVEASGERGAQVAAGLAARGLWADTNRDPARLVVVALTGVTALARATASMMELRGYDFPAEYILPFLAGADIVHTSNEVSFTPACPPPQWEGDTTFCSNPAYIQLLKTIGLDVVELTGNHINDYGTDALLYTLDLYEREGIVYYGGGRDLTDALTPRIIAAPDGTQIAFVGCNIAGPWYAFAGEENAGSAPCDDWSAITTSIRDLKASGQADVVIATVQYWERQRYPPTDEQIADFDLLAEAGADIVSGSQAHQPHGFGFTGGTFIHYGVGNLFFDQMQTLGYRQMFIDKHIIYAGRHISTVLFTGLMEDYSQPNPMTPSDRAVFLNMMFTEASNW
jgi:poly-gamma-glutamate synthesis protein (capsule biosynthesis protein)